MEHVASSSLPALLSQNLIHMSKGGLQPGSPGLLSFGPKLFDTARDKAVEGIGAHSNPLREEFGEYLHGLLPHLLQESD